MELKHRSGITCPGIQLIEMGHRHLDLHAINDLFDDSFEILRLRQS